MSPPSRRRPALAAALAAATLLSPFATATRADEGPPDDILVSAPVLLDALVAVRLRLPELVLQAPAPGE